MTTTAPNICFRRSAPLCGALRFLEYFTVNIRNRYTRAAYARGRGCLPAPV
jgi:hypothetical protein